MDKGESPVPDIKVDTSKRPGPGVLEGTRVQERLKEINGTPDPKPQTREEFFKGDFLKQFGETGTIDRGAATKEINEKYDEKFQANKLAEERAKALEWKYTGGQKKESPMTVAEATARLEEINQQREAGMFNQAAPQAETPQTNAATQDTLARTSVGAPVGEPRDGLKEMEALGQLEPGHGDLLARMEREGQLDPGRGDLLKKMEKDGQITNTNKTAVEPNPAAKPATATTSEDAATKEAEENASPIDNVKPFPEDSAGNNPTPSADTVTNSLDSMEGLPDSTAGKTAPKPVTELDASVADSLNSMEGIAEVVPVAPTTPKTPGEASPAKPIKSEKKPLWKRMFEKRSNADAKKTLGKDMSEDIDQVEPFADVVQEEKATVEKKKGFWERVRDTRDRIGNRLKSFFEKVGNGAKNAEAKGAERLEQLRDKADQLDGKVADRLEKIGKETKDNVVRAAVKLKEKIGTSTMTALDIAIDGASIPAIGTLGLGVAPVEAAIVKGVELSQSIRATLQEKDADRRELKVIKTLEGDKNESRLSLEASNSRKKAIALREAARGNKEKIEKYRFAKRAIVAMADRLLGR